MRIYMLGKKIDGIRQEYGVTANSIHNAKLICKKIGIPRELEIRIDSDRCDWVVIATWEGSLKPFVFTGFATGYYGEGPRGMYWFLHDLLNLNISMETIESWRGKRTIHFPAFFQRYRDKN